MRNNSFFLLLFFICLVNYTYSQVENQEEEDIEYFKPIRFEKYSVGLSVSSFINNFGGVQLSQDIGLTEKWNISMETAYIFYRLDNKPVKGFRIKPGIQYMTYSDESFAVSIGLNYLYRRTETEREFNRNNFEEQFTEIRYIDRIRTISAGEFFFSIYYKIAERARIELGCGIGYGILKLESEKESPDGFRLENVELFYPNDGIYSFPVISFNVNITYDLVLWKS